MVNYYQQFRSNSVLQLQDDVDVHLIRIKTLVNHVVAVPKKSTVALHLLGEEKSMALDRMFEKYSLTNVIIALTIIPAFGTPIAWILGLDPKANTGFYVFSGFVVSFFL